MRAYLALAHPGVRCGRGVQFGRGARVRAYAGGRVTIGARTLIDDHALIEAIGGTLTIGREVRVGRGAVVICHEAVGIGDHTLIAEHVTIRDQDHLHGGPATLDAQGMVTAPIAIGASVWLAAKVTVTRGVAIADRAVVGANAVVTRSLPERGVYGGIPARRIDGDGARA